MMNLDRKCSYKKVSFGPNQLKFSRPKSRNVKESH